MDFAERIKRQRKKMGLNQEELAERLGVSITTIRRWEWGARMPNTEILPKLAEILGTTVSYLMGFNSDAPTPTPDLVTSTLDKKEEDNHTQSQIKTEDKGIFRYTFENGEKLELPAMPEFTGLFERMVAKRLLNNHAYAAATA